MAYRINKEKAVFVRFIILLLCFTFIFPPAVLAETGAEPVVNSVSLILIDARSGKVLFEKNADERRQVASTTKIMTALLVLEKLGISESVSISGNASRFSNNKIKYNDGESRSAEEMLYSLMLLSANNVATAFAEKIGGTESSFVEMMNLKTVQIGAVNSVFSNPHGLPSSASQYSTARDLSLITRKVMRHPIFRRVVASKEHDFEIADGPLKRIENSNDLLHEYSRATGVKTGYTLQAGYCLVGSAKKGGLSLIAVVLGSQSRKQTFDESKRLFKYGFDNYSYRHLIVKGKSYDQVEVAGSKKMIELVADKDISLLINDATGTITYMTDVIDDIRRPIKKGDVLGELIVKKDDVEIVRSQLVSKREMKEEIKVADESFFSSILRRFLKLLGLD